LLTTAVTGVVRLIVKDPGGAGWKAMETLRGGGDVLGEWLVDELPPPHPLRLTVVATQARSNL
jgi:hypothetical protein